jgi:hypothetical protein
MSDKELYKLLGHQGAHCCAGLGCESGSWLTPEAKQRLEAYIDARIEDARWHDQIGCL